MVLAFCLLGLKPLAADGLQGSLQDVNPGAQTLTMAGVVVNIIGAGLLDDFAQTIPLGAFRPGDQVIVDGTFTAPGRFTALTVTRNSFLQDKIKAQIDTVDQEEGIIKIYGVKVKIGPETKLQDDQQQTINWSQLFPGMTVNCLGRWSGNLSFEAQAVVLED